MLLGFLNTGLSITSKTNLKIVDYLEVTFNLQSNSYKSYRKPGNLPGYIHKQSNHPPTILNELPKTIAKRISDLSSSENIFHNAIPVYKEALRRSGFTSDLVYTSKGTGYYNNEENKKRRHKTIWFNLSFSRSVKKNISKTFLNLIKRHFPKTNNLHKIFNENTVKVSYSCMSNMATLLSSHNLNVINPFRTQAYGCNCRTNESCPLQNLTPKTIYRADVENDTKSEAKFYFGLTETPFKDRFGNHSRDFKHKTYSKSTELSKYISGLKDRGINPIVKWSIVEKIHNNTKINSCKLCLLEKMYTIDFIDDNRLLSKRNEFISGCKHQNKLLLKNLK